MATDEVVVDGTGDEALAEGVTQADDVAGDEQTIRSLKPAAARRLERGHQLYDASRDGAALPLPDELAAYDRAGPGWADWRIQTFEDEAAHRRWREKALTIRYLASSVAVGGTGWVLLRLLL